MKRLWSKKRLPRLFGDQGAREKWDAGLSWFRLRYQEAAGPTRCINLLSQSQACGRVTLYHCPGEMVSRLYLGVPEVHVRLLQRMAADFGFSLKLESWAALPPAQRMTAVPDLPLDRPFLAHIVDGMLFVNLSGGDDPGRFLPRPKHSGISSGSWQLPAEPWPGLTMRPSWNGQQPPAPLVAHEPDVRRWLLGRSQTGVPLHVAGRINIYGRREAVAEWLTYQVTQMISLDHSNLVVIDGVGDLVPRLKRKAAVTRLLGEQLAYVDMDAASLAGGFNPLAGAPGETEADLVVRWQRWFQGMSVHPQGIQLLERARQDGVGDIPSLRKWLKQAERQGQYAAVSSLGMALNRLTASRSLREWLEWPTNQFDILPEGALFFAVKGTDWARQQLLRAVLLGVIQVAGARLIVHGFPWRAFTMAHLENQEQAIVSNGPLLSESTVVLTESHGQGVMRLADRFLGGDNLLSENLALLGRGEGMVISQQNIIFASWHPPRGEEKSLNHVPEEDK